jgi:hypothetical protein
MSPLDSDGWTEEDERRRIATLLGCGWSVEQLALVFGMSVEEIDRLAGGQGQPGAAAARSEAQS